VIAAGAAALTALACGWLALGGRRAEARPPAQEPEAFRTGKFDGAEACSDCHTQPRGAYLRPGEACDFVLMTEYAIWRVNDKHSLAYAVLRGDRSKRIGQLLGKDVDVLNAKTGCLNCHAMDAPPERRGDKFNKEEGVSCGGCHGPSSLWLEPHKKATWRLNSQADKEKLGMRDLRDPAKRAALCLSCHVGNAAEGKVVTHPMFAAGHPPLPPIEIATFSRNEPQHWRDAKDVPYFKQKDLSPEVRANYHLDVADFQRTQLALVGTAAALRGTMELAVTRANLQATPAGTVWPELLMPIPGQPTPQPTAERARQDWPELAMAHSDCYGCHHDLAYPSPRQQRGFGYRLPGHDLLPATPGRPMVRAWSLATVGQAADYARDEGRLKDLAAALDRLTRACNARPFGGPEQIKDSAGGVGECCDRLATRMKSGDVKYTEASALRLLHDLGKMEAVANADYETARQIGSIFQVVYDEWGLKGRAKDPERDREMGKLASYLNLQPYTERKERLVKVVGAIDKLSGAPHPEDAKKFITYVNNIGDPELLKAMDRNQFLAEVRQLDPRKVSTLLESRPLAKNLQDLSNAELKHALERMNAYRPDEFKKRLAAICAKLPPPKSDAPARQASKPR
jgi:hypothetical protein